MNQSLRGTRTLENLKVGFLREAQANLRYHFFARRADMKRLHEVARILRSAADEESGHAFGHLDLLLDFGGEQRDLACERMEDNLKSAIEAELHEFTTLYRGFAEVAQEEGFHEVARWFLELSKAGRTHALWFQECLEKLKRL
jgi:rubrerythrin